MRRPTTKFPNPVIRTAVRHRGYGTRVLYYPVERPAFHGKFYYFQMPDGSLEIAMTKDDLVYWCAQSGFPQTWAAMIAAPSPAAFWNSYFRTVKGADVATSWAEVLTFIGGYFTVTAGPISEVTVLDSITV